VSESDSSLTVPAEEISIKPQRDTEDFSDTYQSNYDERESKALQCVWDKTPAFFPGALDIQKYRTANL